MPKKPQEVGDKYIEIVVDENGKTTIEAHGFNGIGCREATAQIEARLGGVSFRKKKDPPGAKQTIRRR